MPFTDAKGERVLNGVPIAPTVRGGSGRRYWTATDALAGESSLAVSDAFAPQAGTTPGVLVLPAGASAVDDFYKDRWVVNTDATPTNGLVNRTARIASYDGASRTATLDAPWDFVGESEVTIVQPIRIMLDTDVTENVTFANPVEFDLAGHRLRGTLDITGGVFHWVRDGWVTDGIQKTNIGFLRLTQLSVSRRDSTIYAVLLTNGSNLGRVELEDCSFFGRVAGRRGRAGWTIKDCKNLSVADGTNPNIPYALVESVSGASITLTQIDAVVDGRFGGAFVFSDAGGSITGTAYMSIMGTAFTEDDFFEAPASQPKPRVITLFRVHGNGTLTPTVATGAIKLSVNGSYRRTSNFDDAIPVNFAWMVARESTVNATVTLSSSGFGQFNVDVNGTIYSCGILVEGTADTTSIVTLAGVAAKVITGSGQSIFTFIFLEDNLVGSGQVNISGSGGWTVIGFKEVDDWTFGISQTSGTPSSTISVSRTVVNIDTFNLMLAFPGVSVSVGTFTDSGGLTINGANSVQIKVTSPVSGGTWAVSGATKQYSVRGGGSVAICSHEGSSSSLTVSNATEVFASGRLAAFEIAKASGTSSTAIHSGTLTVVGADPVVAVTLINASGTSSIARVQNTTIFRDCTFPAAVTVLNTSATGTAEGPPTLLFEQCFFKSTVTDRTGAGIFTWASATWRYQNCHVDGLWTFTGTSFTTVEAFETFFNGNSSNKSISASGTRPTTYRLWKCGTIALNEDLKPEIVDDYTVQPGAAAFANKGIPLTINTSGQAATPGATSHLEGALLASVAGAGNPAILVRRGKIFLRCGGAVAAGDNLVLDIVALNEFDQGASVLGQRGGRALEAVGATNANEAYSVVNFA